MALLIGMSESIKGQKFELKPDRTTLGRNPNNTIVIDDGAVSSQHCYISHRGGRYILHDLNSTNGTRLNSKPVTEAELQPKQVLQIGSTELMFDGDSQETQVASTIVSPDVVVDRDPMAAKPQSFSSVSPFSKSRHDEKKFWLVVILAAGVLALAGLVAFVYKLLT